MSKITNLTKGPIFSQLVRLALPIIATSLIQMLYNLADMAWIGRFLGSGAVAAVGAAGFFLWFGQSFLLCPKLGAEIGVAQALGAKKVEEARGYAAHAVGLAFVLSVLYAIVAYWLAPQLIGFFRLNEVGVSHQGVEYLRIVAIGFPFFLVNPTLSGFFNGIGDSKTPFRINSYGLLFNIIVDPILIIGIGPIPALGVQGAAFATVLSQIVVFFLFWFKLRPEKNPFKKPLFQVSFNGDILKGIFKLGIPFAGHSALFAIFAMIIARMVTRFGDIPLAVQSVGAQIEAITWMTATGFETALGSFVGQNYGARNWHRIRNGFLWTSGIGLGIGLLVTIFFMSSGSLIYSVFYKESEAISLGGTYLFILGISQIFMMIEIISSGGFNGIGRTVPPAVIGVVFTGLRIPAAWLLSSEALLGLYGVWWSISISSILKGSILFIWFWFVLRKHSGVRVTSLWMVARSIPTRLKHQIVNRKESDYLPPQD